jgi:hypothetical protein
MSKIYTTIILSVALIVLLLPVSCEADYYVPEEVVIPDSVKFSIDIQPIFDLNCNLSSCHETGGIAPDLSPVNAYSNLMAYGLIDINIPESSNLYVRLTSVNTPMPPEGKLSEANTEIILAWIRQGALDN